MRRVRRKKAQEERYLNFSGIKTIHRPSIIRLLVKVASEWSICQKVLRTRCVGFFTCPLLSCSIRLRLPPRIAVEDPPTVGRRCVLNLQILVILILLFAWLIGKSYYFEVSQLVQRVFSGRNPSRNAVRHTKIVKLMHYFSYFLRLLLFCQHGESCQGRVNNDHNTVMLIRQLPPPRRC